MSVANKATIGLMRVDAVRRSRKQRYKVVRFESREIVTHNNAGSMYNDEQARNSRGIPENGRGRNAEFTTNARGHLSSDVSQPVPTVRYSRWICPILQTEFDA